MILHESINAIPQDHIDQMEGLEGYIIKPDQTKLTKYLIVMKLSITLFSSLETKKNQIARSSFNGKLSAGCVNTSNMKNNEQFENNVD